MIVAASEIYDWKPKTVDLVVTLDGARVNNPFAWDEKEGWVIHYKKAERVGDYTRLKMDRGQVRMISPIISV